jgi:hypothetical protein
MNSIIIKAGIFAAGLGIGFFAGKKFYQEKYRKMADEDIASVNEMTTRRINEMKQAIMDVDDEEENVEISTTEDIEDISDEELKTNERIVMQYNKAVRKEGEVESIRPKPTKAMIYVISQEEFMEEGDYDKVSLEYFEGDKVLVDDRDIPVDDPDSIIGEGTLDDFAISEDAEMYVRNDNISVDYELTKSEGSYRDFIDGPQDE